MKIHKVSSIIMGILSLISIALAAWFSFFQNQIYYNIILAIFGSAITLFIHSIIMYIYNYKEIIRLLKEEAQILQNFIVNISMYNRNNGGLTFTQIEKLWTVISSTSNSIRKLKALTSQIDCFTHKKIQKIEEYLSFVKIFEDEIYNMEFILANFYSEVMINNPEEEERLDKELIKFYKVVTENNIAKLQDKINSLATL